ncbi:MAG: hypothetical protein R3C59_00685 [Planctomycetaceae bacterium]
MDPLRITRWLKNLLTLAVLAVALMAPTQAQQRPATAIEKLAELLGGALKAATGKEEPKAARPAPAVLFAQPAVPLAEKEVKERLKRLQAYAAVMQDWVDAQCELTEEQTKNLAAATDKAISVEQLSWKNGRPNDQRNNRGLSDFFPVRFTDTNGAARAVEILRVRSKLTGVQLTTEQTEKLAAAVEERKQFHRGAALGYILNLLDDELFLTADQRQVIGAGIRKKVNLEAACYSFMPQTYYFDQTSIVDTVREGNDYLEVLTKSQKQRAKDLAALDGGSYNSEQYISFSSDEGIDTWQDKLREAGLTQKERLQRAVAVRVDFYEMAYDLPPQSARRLLVAGKGAVDEVVAAWQEQTQRQLKSYEDQMGRFAGGNFSFSMSVADIRQLEHNDIWKYTVESVVTGTTDAMAARNEARSAANARFIVAMLDKELWLEPFQRDRLLTAVQNELPSPDYNDPNRRYFGEISLLCIPLFKFSKHDLTVLSRNQKTTWEVIREPFQFDGNYVRVQMQNGGQMSFVIPK